MAKNYIAPEKIIGIGASAGGLEPLQQLIQSLPKNLKGCSFIVAQHLSPNYKSVLKELLAKKTNISVEDVSDGVLIQPNTIYVIQPKVHVGIDAGRFKVLVREEIFPKPSVNILFNSIAEEYGENAIAIILSGTGRDGSEGMVQVHENGGVCIAQNLETCKYAGMPQSAIKTGVLDYILKPEDIGKNIHKISVKGKIRGNRKPKETAIRTPEQLATTEVLGLLEHKLGVDFSNYKKGTIGRRLNKRMKHGKFDNVEQYLQYVNNTPEELDELFKVLLIGVTKFYRDEAVFEEVEKALVKLVERKYNKEESIRIWIAGCASGEEAYTFAIMLNEIIRKKEMQDLNVQIFATDIDEAALKFARKGFYPKERIEQLPDDIIKRYFKKRKDKYEISPELRQNVLFSKHDLTANPPFLKLDFISCRNLLIYFNLTLQRQVFPVFHYALNSDGFLLLGKSETIGAFKNLFSVYDASSKIFNRKQADNKFYSFPHLKPTKKEKVIPADNNLRKEDITIAGMIKETFYNTFEHPYVVVDENLDMVEVIKDISRYVKFKPGVITTNLLKVTEPDLQLEIRSLATKAVKTNKVVKGKIRQVRLNENEKEYVRITIKPLLYARPMQPYFVVIFESFDFEGEFPVGVIPEGEGLHEDPRIIQLDQELEATKEHMNTLIEELETSNEELQSTNEELQSSNEELQASNEELETSNEELQASNEELEVAYTENQKANKEIQRQRQELMVSQNRLKALFDSTMQGHILLDEKYNILTFNERARRVYQDLFEIVLKEQTSYVDSIPNEYFKNFHQNFKKALSGSISKTIAEFKGDVFFSYHYIPIDPDDSGENMSVLISFSDITAEKRAEKRLMEVIKVAERQKDLWKQLFTNAPDNIAILSGEELKFEYVNPNYKKLLGKRKITGKTVKDVFPKTEATRLSYILEHVLETGDTVTENEVAVSLKKKSRTEIRYMDFSYALVNLDDDTKYVIVFAVDVTQKISDRKAVQETADYMELLLDMMPQKMFTTSADGKNDYNNNQMEEFTGLSNKKLIENGWEKVIHPEDLQETWELWENSMKEGQPFQLNQRLRSYDGEFVWHLTRTVPLKNKNGKVYKWIGTSTDIHEQVESENMKDEFLNLASHELKTPLTTVITYTELLARHPRLVDEDEVQRYIEKSLHNQKRLKDLMSDLLDVTRIESGKLELNKQMVDYNEILNSAVENIKYAQNSHKINVLGEIHSVVNLDTSRIEQVIANLLTNAIKYSPEESEIKIVVEEVDGKEIITSVIDYGIGIPIKDQEHIFNRFYRVSNHKSVASGLGIGLYVTQQIIERHGGKLKVESQLGKGSTFSFSLPINSKTEK